MLGAMGSLQNCFRSIISYRVIEEHFISNVFQLPLPSKLTSMIRVDDQGFSHNAWMDMCEPLSDHLKLKFVLDLDETLAERASPVCYAHSNDLRDGFEMDTPKSFFTYIDALNFIYAVLHSSTYREEHKDFLAIDFPSIPYPKSQNTFWQLASLGNEIRRAHSFEPSTVSTAIAGFPVSGTNTIAQVAGKDRWEAMGPGSSFGRIWINEEQYYDRVPLVAWKFYMGGCHPAQKWLNDREGSGLSLEEILFYQKIIVALTETDRLMKVIDEIEIQ